MTLVRSLIIGALLALATAHMQLTYPAPFNASNNPHRTTAADPYLQYPYDCCGPNDRWTYPCRGYHRLLDTPQGAPTATWAAGSKQSWSIAGIGNHYGGSCQIGFSVDTGESFQVATSYEGNCPHRNSGNGPQGQSFDFTVPDDLQPGIQLFGWIWYNREAELNMNCAAVNITTMSGADQSSTSSPASYGGTPPSTLSVPTSTSAESPNTPIPTYKTANGLACTCTDPTDISKCDCACPDNSLSLNQRSEGGGHHPAKHVHPERARAARVAFLDRPIMFVADDGDSCSTPKTTAELKYPHPGPDVVAGDGVYPLELPSGDCEGVGSQAYGG